MTTDAEKELRLVVSDLAETTHQLAREVQKIATHLERETTRMHEPSELPVVLSELAELHRRVGKLSPASP